MSDINPNTPVTESSSTASSGPTTDGALTFDELDAAMASKSKSRQAKESEESDKVNIPKTEPKGEDDLQDEPPKSASDKKPAKKEAKIEKGGKEEKEPLDKPEPRKIKGKSGDKDFELDEDGLVPVKINGKEEMVQVKELLGNYSGKVAWDKKFSDVDKIRQSVQQSQKSLDMSKSQIKAVFEEKDPTLRLFKMAEIAGVSPAEFRTQYLDESKKAFEKWSTMSEDQRKADGLEFENKYLRYQAETKDKSFKAQQAVTDLDKKVENLLATHSLDKKEFVSYYDQVEALVKEGRLDFGKEGITPEKISEIMVKDKLWAKADETLGELKVQMDDKTKATKIETLVNSAFDHGIKASEIPEIISELWGPKRASKVVSEKVKEQQEFRQGKKATTEKPSSNNGAMFFDEIL